MKKCAVIVVFFMVMTGVSWAEEALALSGADGLARLRAQVQAQRQKEEEMGLLQLEVERLKLEVEKKKAMAELGRLSAGPGMGQTVASNEEPTVVLRSVFMVTGKQARKAAGLEVGGIERRVEEGAEVAGFTVKSITLDGVVLRSKAGMESSFALQK